MLLEFQAHNYKSFRDGMKFSMIPAPRLTDLDYSIAEERVKGKPIRALSSAIIYGPNASGKTNIIGAMSTFKQIVLRGNIRNGGSNVNIAACNLELIPFFKQERECPVTFDIVFLESGILFQYNFSMLIGSFMNAKFERKIIKEELYINHEVAFLRTENKIRINLSKISQWLNTNENNESVTSFAENSLNEQELFLMNGFKTVVSQKLVGIVTDWLESKFNVFYRANDMEARPKMSEEKKNHIEVNPEINEAAKLFGISSNEIGFIYPNESEEAKLASIIKGEKTFALNAEAIESFGTIRFINELPVIISTLVNGGTLVVDEFDASIHPMALMSIINVFHNDSINVKHAQLIFNTHNPIFLNANLFRRDEIKFVERDDESGVSELYQLSDFGTSGENGVRKGEDYLKNYFINRYGAIKEIDFSPLFEKIMSAVNEEKKK